MIRIRGLTLHPPGAQAPVLDRFYSDVPDGGFLLLTGPAGAGKTTVLRLLATLEAPTAGTADIAGADLRGDDVEVRARVGYLAAESLGPERPGARALVTRDLRVRGWAEAEGRAEAVLGALGLRDVGDVPLGALPAGTRRRALLARAVAPDPPVLLLDEPLAHLDLVEREVVWALLRAAKRSGRSILAAARLPSGLGPVADAVAVLRDGRCLARGACDDVRLRARAKTLEEAVLSALALDGLPGAQEAIDARPMPAPAPAAAPREAPQEGPPPSSAPSSP